MRNVYNSTLNYKFGENPTHCVVTAKQKSYLGNVNVLLGIVLYLCEKR